MKNKVDEIISQDASLIIAKFLEGKHHLITENDSLNISLFLVGQGGWNFSNIDAPTIDELHDLIPTINHETSQCKTNIEALKLLADTDWLIVRELDCGIPCPSEIKQARAEARSRIIK
jgi:hypothetical protein